MFYLKSHCFWRTIMALAAASSFCLTASATEPEASPAAADLLSAPVSVGDTPIENDSVPGAAVKGDVIAAQSPAASSKDAIEPPSLIPPPATGPAATAPSQNVTINLINRLVERGVLTKEDAAELIQQAEEDAALARAQAAAPTPPPPADDEVRVTYVPEVVKAQIRDEIKQEVIDQAREEHWAAPNSIPEWVSRFSGFWRRSGPLRGETSTLQATITRALSRTSMRSTPVLHLMSRERSFHRNIMLTKIGIASAFGRAPEPA